MQVGGAAKTYDIAQLSNFMHKFNLAAFSQNCACVKLAAPNMLSTVDARGEGMPGGIVATGATGSPGACLLWRRNDPPRRI